MVEVNKKRVLIVDDEEDVRAYISTFLADRGFEVVTAGSGLEAMRLVKEKRPDVITLDIVMPQKTGVKFYRDIKNDPANSDIPVIIITGLQSDFKGFISHRRGTPPPAGYISKPFEKEKLLEEVERVLGLINEKTPNSQAGSLSVNL